MARKKKHEEHENHERWLVSYADFITLLFAFFVVMYSVSSVNEGKYRVLSSSMVTAFKKTVRSLEPIQVGIMSKDISSRVILRPTKSVMLEIPGVPGARSSEQESGKGKLKDDDNDDLRSKEGLRSSGVVMRKIGEDLEKALSSLIDRDLVSVSKDTQRVEVEIKSSVLFQSGSATISLDAIPILETVGSILKPFPNEVLVEGYTDNTPISNMIYPSNWELSAARSASVVHLFMKTGIDPARMTAMGYAEYRPTAENDTAEGRSKNRRVVLVIPAQEEAKDIVEGLTDMGIEIGGRGPKEDDKQTEEPLISNITLIRDSVPGMDVSPSEIIMPIDKSGVSKTDASRSTDTTTDQVTGAMMDEKPGIFPVTISPFQLPVLPTLKDLVDEKKSVTEKSSDKADSEKDRSASKPSLKGEIETIQQSDENIINTEREIKLQRTTDIGREVQPQTVIIPESIEKSNSQSTSKRESQQNNKGSTDTAVQEGKFPIFKLPVLPELKGVNGNAEKSTGSAKSKSQQGQSISRPVSKPVTKPGSEGDALEKEAKPTARRKVTLDKVTAPSYESKPQQVSIPQQTENTQQEGGGDIRIQEGEPVNNQKEQDSRQGTQRPRVIAPPIQLPFRNIVPDSTEDTTDNSTGATDGTTKNNTQPAEERP